MQYDATQRTNQGTKDDARFTPALDARKRKIRGLWIRNGRYYLQTRIQAGNGKSRPVRVPLSAQTLDAAKAEIEKRRTQNREGEMHTPGKRPKFEGVVEAYQLSAVFLGKKEGTRQNETQALNRWNAHIGGIRVDWVTTDHIATFQANRKKEGVVERTINLDTVAFNNVMKFAITRHWITRAPRLTKLKERKPPRRPLLTASEVQTMIDASTPTVTKNAALFANYLRFLAYTGCREQEALKVRVADVDLRRGVVVIGGTGDTKNSLGREIQFNGKLKALMEELLPAHPPDTQWLFPSPQRGAVDRHAHTLRESLRAVRSAAKLEWVGFHDFRHYFASVCVMAGIDFMTIAKWLGHQDGGMLVAKVYGHLSDKHQRDAAAKLVF